MRGNEVEVVVIVVVAAAAAAAADGLLSIIMQGIYKYTWKKTMFLGYIVL
jgi:hypothetical protein